MAIQDHILTACILKKAKKLIMPFLTNMYHFILASGSALKPSEEGAISMLQEYQLNRNLLKKCLHYVYALGHIQNINTFYTSLSAQALNQMELAAPPMTLQQENYR